ncbi:SMP-30/gluconolactonase/LRE family protein [Amycolatopsis albispora]|uniref:Gluconolactonase n=1 Tax=Amycolatopsis albispora TaxID=1804986 RepID=A0A344L4C0_9PSEU|nr:SMP-30/gluconolactonase/LRE family protein [Amycolatopsis albispora]AXB42894.1 gluconolactonase [Amycolatopsis albispora]
MAEPVTEALAWHGEGPVWWQDTLVWVDMLAGDVLSMDSTGQVTRAHVGSVAAALRPRRSGGWVLATERGFALADELTGPITPLGPLWIDDGIRMNDGGCDPDGRFYCGSMAYDARPGAGALFRLDPGGDVERVLGGVTISNGFAFSPDGTTAYYVDTPTGRIDAFDYSSQDGLTGRREFVKVEPPGDPDGITVDAEGGVWVALWGGSAVRRYDAGGVLDAVIDLPVSQVTACTFGGPGLTRLYITTSQQDAAPDHRAGAVFAAEPGVAGLPALTFAG